MKLNIYIIRLFIVLSTAFCGFCTSCEDDPDELQNSINVDSNINDGSCSNSNNEVSIDEIINNKVKIDSYYYDYYVNTFIESSLSSSPVLRGKSIKYGIEFGYSGKYVWQQFCENFSGGIGSIKSTIFFSCGDYDYDYDELYVKAYIELRDRMNQGETLRSDEMNLYNAALKHINEDEPVAIREYNARFFVEIENKRYFVKDIQLALNTGGGSDNGETNTDTSGNGSGSYNPNEGDNTGGTGNNNENGNTNDFNPDYNFDDVYISGGTTGFLGDGVYSVKGVEFKMIDVEGGTFQMGSKSASDTQPVHKVTLDNYQMGQTEVTQELWVAVMGNNPSITRGYRNLPVEDVSWKDCQQFIGALNNLLGTHFRLPTEAEWEFAARGGNNTHGFIYSGSNYMDNVGWFKGNSVYTYLNGSTGRVETLAGSHPVGTKQANELGIYDMSGNQIEWCQDYYGAYSSADQTNPSGPSSPTKENGYVYRVMRGGYYYSPDAPHCKVETRYKGTESSGIRQIGFRLAQ